MDNSATLPRVVLICHAEDRLDSMGLAAWLASTTRLVGIVSIHESRQRRLAKARREIRRAGWLRFIDALAFRTWYRLFYARRDALWIEAETAKLRARYPIEPRTQRLAVNDPNGEETRAFLARLRPDLAIARCKFILRPEIFEIPSRGTYVLHPGICPEYRNAHGCFWALANRDLGRVGMTLLRADAGVDTGSVLLQASYRFDERRESHVVMQYRMVTENLDAVSERLLAAWRGMAQPLPVAHRRSATWGQPWFTAWLKWRRAVRAKERDRSNDWRNSIPSAFRRDRRGRINRPPSR